MSPKLGDVVEIITKRKNVYKGVVVDVTLPGKTPRYVSSHNYNLTPKDVETYVVETRNGKVRHEFFWTTADKLKIIREAKTKNRPRCQQKNNIELS